MQTNAPHAAHAALYAKWMWMCSGPPTILNAFDAATASRHVRIMPSPVPFRFAKRKKNSNARQAPAHNPAQSIERKLKGAYKHSL